MKRINSFLDKAPLWQIFIFGWVLITILCFLFFYLIPDGSKQAGNVLFSLKFSAAMGLMIGGFVFSLLVSMGRKSDKFWEHAKEVEKLVDEANTKQELLDIQNDQFKKLRTLSMGNPHGYELQRIYTIMKTKYKFLNK